MKPTKASRPKMIAIGTEIYVSTNSVMHAILLNSETGCIRPSILSFMFCIVLFIVENNFLILTQLLQNIVAAVVRGISSYADNTCTSALNKRQHFYNLDICVVSLFWISFFPGIFF